MNSENKNSQTNPAGEAAGTPPDAAVPAAPATDELKTENENLKRALRLREARDAVVREFRNAGAVSPELLSKAVEGELQLDGEGALLNAAAVVQKLKREFPSQFAPAAPPTAIDGGAGSALPTILTKEALAKMSPAQVAALDWQEVRRVLSGR